MLKFIKLKNTRMFLTWGVATQSDLDQDEDSEKTSIEFDSI